MIVVSGVLVLVALVFLIIGLLQDSGLGFIWASIITSVVAGVFLLLGALQRRGAVVPATEGGGATSGEMLDRVTAVSVRPREADGAAADTTAAADAPTVAVVRGRPRYHVDACRFLAGRPDVEHLTVDEARGEGFTACGVCKPDAALAAAAAPEPEPAMAESASDTSVMGLDGGMDTAGDEAAADEPAEEPAAPRKTAARTATKTAAKPAKKAAAATGTSSRGATATATKTAAAAKAPAKAAAGQVVVIPDRGKFHTETCRFVKDVPGTVNLSKAAAKRQGYTPCGVCKP